MSIETGGPSHEEIDEDGLTAEQREMANRFEGEFPNRNLAEGERVDLKQFVEMFEAGLNLFESKHSLEALNAITNLTPAEAPHHPIREQARKDLIPIVTLLNVIKEKTNISKPHLDELTRRYLVLSKAVGMINNNKVRH